MILIPFLVKIILNETRFSLNETMIYETME